MKAVHKLRFLFLLAFLVAGSVASLEAVAQPGMGMPVDDFYDELAPYGRWMEHPTYGEVWSPNVGRDFQPYATDGHWVMTEYGNTWVSDYPWGWAPFHYGRWFYDDYNGWAWVPGDEWGPAWVSWRSGGGYYGWAPLGPGIGVNVSINIPSNFWVFVPQTYISHPRIYSYYVPRPRVVTIYNQTTIINNYYRNNNRVYSYGPRHNGPIYRVDNLGRPGRSEIRSGAVGFYRPNIAGNWRSGYSRGERDNRNAYRNNQRDNWSNNNWNRPDDRRDAPNGGYRNRDTDLENRRNNGSINNGNRANDRGTYTPQNNNWNRPNERRDAPNNWNQPENRPNTNEWNRPENNRNNSRGGNESPRERPNYAPNAEAPSGGRTVPQYRGDRQNSEGRVVPVQPRIQMQERAPGQNQSQPEAAPGGQGRGSRGPR
ncbi:DUF6600 domain-containing protein [Tellurirhabdus bombi]|uniref:DUF6600 domain-containing protein n=1 Tax=Tellurirhabdus bombi TaxID=2907205 RepID=UPI001F29A099|nr:DUF6600 domain-containing protein [Tellurirhabdus bombi]